MWKLFCCWWRWGIRSAVQRSKDYLCEKVLIPNRVATGKVGVVLTKKIASEVAKDNEMKLWAKEAFKVMWCQHICLQINWSSYEELTFCRVFEISRLALSSTGVWVEMEVERRRVYWERLRTIRYKCLFSMRIMKRWQPKSSQGERNGSEWWKKEQSKSRLKSDVVFKI